MSNLKAKIVVPSHGSLGGSFDQNAITATKEYLEYAVSALAENNGSAAVTDKLLSRFPKYDNKGVVELGAKVITGELIWG